MANHTRFGALIQTRAPQADNANKYDPEHCWQVRLLAMEGLFPEEWCAHFGITMGTMYNWANRYPDFDQACHEAWYLLRAHWTQKARESIQGRGMAPSILAMILEKRFPDTWGKNPRNTHETFASRNDPPDQGEGPETPQSIAEMDDDMLQQHITKLQARRAHDGKGE